MLVRISFAQGCLQPLQYLLVPACNANMPCASEQQHAYAAISRRYYHVVCCLPAQNCCPVETRLLHIRNVDTPDDPCNTL